MKKRRTLVIGLLLVAALCLGIGYAALTDDLLINGQINYDPEVAEDELDGDVLFTATTHDDYCYSAVSGSDATGDTALLYIGGDLVAYELAAPGQVAVATYTVTNNYESPVQITLDEEVTTLLNGKFNVIVDLSGVANIAPGGEGIISISVEPEDVLTEAISAEAFAFNFTATVIND